MSCSVSVSGTSNETRLPGSVNTEYKYITSATEVVSVNKPACVTPCTLPSSHGTTCEVRRQAPPSEAQGSCHPLCAPQQTPRSSR